MHEPVVSYTLQYAMMLISLVGIVYFTGVTVVLYEGMERNVIEKSIEESDGVDHIGKLTMFVYVVLALRWPYTLANQGYKYYFGDGSKIIENFK